MTELKNLQEKLKLFNPWLPPEDSPQFSELKCLFSEEIVNFIEIALTPWKKESGILLRGTGKKFREKIKKYLKN